MVKTAQEKMREGEGDLELLSNFTVVWKFLNYRVI